MHLSASPRPGANQNGNSNHIEVTFFSTTSPLSTSVQDLKYQIRQLLNVYCDHASPERLDPQFQFYDEVALNARRRNQIKPALNDQLCRFS